MKSTLLTLSALALLGALTGCAPKDTPPAETATPPVAAAPETGSPKTPTGVVTGHPLGTLKVGGRAVCAVCSVKEGTKETEEVKATLDYKGKTYGFCNESEKAEFISDPAKYAQK